MTLSMQDFDADSEKREFLKAVEQGLEDIEEERTVSLAEVRKRLGLA